MNRSDEDQDKITTLLTEQAVTVGIARVLAWMAENGPKIERIDKETTKTNGRVTKLELEFAVKQGQLKLLIGLAGMAGAVLVTMAQTVLSALIEHFKK